MERPEEFDIEPLDSIQTRLCRLNTMAHEGSRPLLPPSHRRGGNAFRRHAVAVVGRCGAGAVASLLPLPPPERRTTAPGRGRRARAELNEQHIRPRHSLLNRAARGAEPPRRRRAQLRSLSCWVIPFQRRREAERDLLGDILCDARQDHDVATTSAILGGDAGTERTRIVRISRGLVLEENPRGAVLEHLLFRNTDGSEERWTQRLELLPGLASHHRDGRCGVVKYSRSADFTEWHPFRRHCNLTGARTIFDDLPAGRHCLSLSHDAK